MTSKILVPPKNMIKLNFVTQVLKVIWCFGSKIVNIVYFVRFSLVFFVSFLSKKSAQNKNAFNIAIDNTHSLNWSI